MSGLKSFLKIVVITMSNLFLLGCGKDVDHNTYVQGKCVTQTVSNGALITCTDGSQSLILNGTDGVDGVDAPVSGTITEVIDPCGDGPGFDEVILRLGVDQLVAYFEQGGDRFLSILTPGNYSTTDSQSCPFTVNSDFSVTF